MFIHIHGAKGTTTTTVYDAQHLGHLTAALCAAVVTRNNQHKVGDKITVHVHTKDLDPEEHWITMNGAHVYINGAGDILKGPADLVGKNSKDFGHEPKPKPTQAASSTAKAAVHELLSSGHPFTVAELMKASGAKNESTLLTAISDLKNPKYAGKHGVLGIEKMANGMYQIAPTKQALAKPTPATAPMPGLLAPSAPAAEAHAGVVKAPATTMGKAKADKVYAATLSELNKDAADWAKNPDKIKAAALMWKQGKAKAMAEWAANVKGVDQKVAVPEVFKEDEDLVNALALAAQSGDVAGNTAKAIAKWKDATHKAKMAKAPPPSPPLSPSPPPVPVTYSPPDNLPLPAGGYSLPPPPTKLVQDDYDYTPEHLFEGGKFGKELGTLMLDLGSYSGTAVHNKKSVQQNLEERLQASPYFQTIAAQYKNPPTGSGGSLAAQLVSAWAGSSGGHNPVSNAAQLAVRDVFGMKNEHVAFDALSVIKQSGEEGTWEQAAGMLKASYKSDAEKAVFKAAMRDFILAQYHHTQDYFKSKGITHVPLVRGMRKTGGNNTEKVKLKLQPASSFSVSKKVASRFSGSGHVYLAQVPVEQVLGSYLTGYGCTDEHEVVVLAHHSMTAIEVPYKDHANQTAIQLTKLVHQKVFAGPPPPSPPPSPSPPLVAPYTQTVKQLPGFKFKPIPAPTLSVNAANKKHVNAAAEAGDMHALNNFIAHLQSTHPMTMYQSKKYAADVKAALELQLAAHAGKQATASPSAKAVDPIDLTPPSWMHKQHAANAIKAYKEGDIDHLDALLAFAAAKPGGNISSVYLNKLKKDLLKKQVVTA